MNTQVASFSPSGSLLVKSIETAGTTGTAAGLSGLSSAGGVFQKVSEVFHAVLPYLGDIARLIGGSILSLNVIRGTMKLVTLHTMRKHGDPAFRSRFGKPVCDQVIRGRYRGH